MATHTISGQDASRGRDAGTPKDIPAQGWKDVLKRTKDQIKEDNVPLVAAGVAFYAFLALVPSLVAVVSLYGLVASPAEVEEQIGSLTAALPEQAATFITEQLRSISESSTSGLTTGFLFGLLGALWSASAGIGALINALNIAYEEEDGRGFVKRKALALGLTLGAVLLVAAVIGALVVLPVVVDRVISSEAASWALSILRWPLLLVAVAGSLAVLYNVGPHRDRPRFSWVSWGAIIATISWLVASLLFSIYVNVFGSYNETYGTLAGVVLVLLWFWITSLVIIAGAELNSELEHQTARDTTVGPERPMGERDAAMADTVAPDRPSEDATR